MSVTATTQGKLHRRTQRGEPAGVLFVFLGVTALVVSALALHAIDDWRTLVDQASLLLVWVLVAAIADLLPVHLWAMSRWGMSLPVTLAAGMVLSPWSAGLIAFLAALDPREFHREISVARGLYNRSQVAASVVAASVVFHAMNGSPWSGPRS